MLSSNDLSVTVGKDDDFSSSISFPVLETRHSGNYTCEASNEAASDTQSGTLVVNSEYQTPKGQLPLIMCTPYLP